jgi:2-polyprenyl-6-methoxyphenol hydroxylase-like FAD-dependent oxidoreductase
VEAALESYVRRREPRVEWVQRQSMGLANLLTASSARRNATLREKGTQLMQDRFGPLVPPP